MPAVESRRSAFFDDRAATWDATMGADRIAAMRAWCRKVPLRPDVVVLDLGCGTGVTSAALAERLGREGRVIAVDASVAMLRTARAGHDHPRIAWIGGDGAHLPIAPNTLDTIVAMHVWPHLADDGALPEDVLGEWWRALRPGGMFHVVHLISRERVNGIHRSNGAVARDRLVPAADLARIAAWCGFRVTTIADDDRGYLVSAVRV